MKELDTNQKFELFLDEVKREGKKPKILVHVCCGPCATYPLTRLAEVFDVTVIFINPNIYPEEEYEKRFAELKRFIKEDRLNISLIKLSYDHRSYLDYIKGYEDEKEGGKRCELCYKFRIELGMKYASENGFPYFLTVMTISAKKPSKLLNEIGCSLSSKYVSTAYVSTDFKKKDGTLKGIKIAKAFNLYRQDYCGCEFSYRARQAYLEQKKHIN